MPHLRPSDPRGALVVGGEKPLAGFERGHEVEKHDLSSIRIVLSGAAPLGNELEDALGGRLPQAIPARSLAPRPGALPGSFSRFVTGHA